MDNDWTKVLGFPGYRVYKHEIDESHKQMTLWIRRKRGNRSFEAIISHPKVLSQDVAGTRESTGPIIVA